MEKAEVEKKIKIVYNTIGCTQYLKVKCPFCIYEVSLEKKEGVTWPRLSNYYRHLRNHLGNEINDNEHPVEKKIKGNGTLKDFGFQKTKLEKSGQREGQRKKDSMEFIDNFSKGEASTHQPGLRVPTKQYVIDISEQAEEEEQANITLDQQGCSSISMTSHVKDVNEDIQSSKVIF